MSKEQTEHEVERKRTDEYRLPDKVILRTVDEGHVAKASILPFVDLPDVVIWGERIFSKTNLTKVEENGDKVPVYQESFAYTILHTEEDGDTFPVVEEGAAGGKEPDKEG